MADRISEVGLGVGSFLISVQAFLQAGWPVVVAVGSSVVPAVIVSGCSAMILGRLQDIRRISEAHGQHIVRNAVEPLMQAITEEPKRPYAYHEENPFFLLRSGRLGQEYALFPPSHPAWHLLLEHEPDLRSTWEDYQSGFSELLKRIDEEANAVFKVASSNGVPLKRAQQGGRHRNDIDAEEVLAEVMLRGPLPSIVVEGEEPNWNVKVGWQDVVMGSKPHMNQVAENLAKLDFQHISEFGAHFLSETRALDSLRKALLLTADRIREEGKPRNKCTRCRAYTFLKYHG